MSEAALTSCEAYRSELPAHLRDICKSPKALDVCAWPKWLAAGEFDVVFSVNLVHIAPPTATDGLLTGAAAALRKGGRLMMYGPFLVGGKPTTESNAAFDAKLKGMDPRFGLRDADAIKSKAAEQGLRLLATQDMPSNNLFMVFERT